MLMETIMLIKPGSNTHRNKKTKTNKNKQYGYSVLSEEIMRTNRELIGFQLDRFLKSSSLSTEPSYGISAFIFKVPHT